MKMSVGHDPWKRMASQLVLPSLLISVLCFSFAWAEESPDSENKDIIAIGTGLVTDENVARARKEAVADALNKGVEQYLARRLGTQGMITNFPTLVEGVVSSENQEIESFNILAEQRVDKHYKVLVKLRVNERVMQERFREKGVVLLNDRPVKIVFLVSQEEKPGSLSYWWRAPEEGTALTGTELVLHQVFEDFGFFAVNRRLKSLETKYSAEMTAPDLTSEAALQWGEIFSVPVVVQGRCEIKDGKEVFLSLVALDTEKRTIIDQDSQSEIVGTGADGGVNRAVEKAVRSLAARLCPSIRRTIEVEEVKTNQIEVVVKGLRSFRDLKGAKEFLEKEIRGVRSVRQTKLGRDFVGLMVEFSGDKQEFLNLISGQAGAPFVREEGHSEQDPLTFRMK
jgi:hypothetical protein